jgi:hypothetical protein
MDWRRITTSPEVYAVIYARHRDDLVVFSSASDPGGQYGRPSMMTEWGRRVDDVPIIGSRHTWDMGSKPHERINDCWEYWLCAATGGGRDE